jgi:hypothetical protein
MFAPARSLKQWIRQQLAKFHTTSEDEENKISEDLGLSSRLAKYQNEQSTDLNDIASKQGKNHDKC